MGEVEVGSINSFGLADSFADPQLLPVEADKQQETGRLAAMCEGMVAICEMHPHLATVSQGEKLRLPMAEVELGDEGETGHLQLVVTEYPNGSKAFHLTNPFNPQLNGLIISDGWFGQVGGDDSLRPGADQALEDDAQDLLLRYAEALGISAKLLEDEALAKLHSWPFEEEPKQPVPQRIKRLLARLALKKVTTWHNLKTDKVKKLRGPLTPEIEKNQLNKGYVKRDTKTSVRWLRLAALATLAPWPGYSSDITLPGGQALPRPAAAEFLYDVHEQIYDWQHPEEREREAFDTLGLSIPGEALRIGEYAFIPTVAGLETEAEDNIDRRLFQAPAIDASGESHDESRRPWRRLSGVRQVVNLLRDHPAISPHTCLPISLEVDFDDTVRMLDGVGTANLRVEVYPNEVRVCNMSDTDPAGPEDLSGLFIEVDSR